MTLQRLLRQVESLLVPPLVDYQLYVQDYQARYPFPALPSLNLG